MEPVSARIDKRGLKVEAAQQSVHLTDLWSVSLFLILQHRVVWGSHCPQITHQNMAGETHSTPVILTQIMS